MWPWGQLVSKNCCVSWIFPISPWFPCLFEYVSPSLTTYRSEILNTFSPWPYLSCFISQMWTWGARGSKNCRVAWIYAKLLDGLPCFRFHSRTKHKNDWELKFGTQTCLRHIKHLFVFFSKNHFIEHYFRLTGICGRFPRIFVIILYDETRYYSHGMESNDVK